MGPPELIIVGIIAIAVIFGAKKLPEIAHNLGRSSNEFKKGLKEGGEDADAQADAPPQPPQPAQPVQPRPSPRRPRTPLESRGPAARPRLTEPVSSAILPSTPFTNDA